MAVVSVQNCNKMSDYLVVFLCNSGGETLAVEAAMRAAGTVPTATLDEEAAGPEDDICPFQLFS